MSPEEKLRREDRAHLIEQPQFKRLLFEIYSAAGISRTTREEPNVLHLEGKRSLGLEILGWFAREPDDAIAMALNSRMIFSKGTRNDDRSDDPATDE